MNSPGYPVNAARKSFTSMPKLSMEDHVALMAKALEQATPAEIAHKRYLKSLITVPFSLICDEEGNGKA